MARTVASASARLGPPTSGTMIGGWGATKHPTRPMVYLLDTARRSRGHNRGSVPRRAGSAQTVPRPLDDHVPARRARGRFRRVPGDVAPVHVPQPGLAPDAHGLLHSRDRGGRRVQQAVGGVEAGDVPGDVGRHRDQERRQAAQFVVAVVAPRDEEGGHLHPHSHARAGAGWSPAPA